VWVGVGGMGLTILIDCWWMRDQGAKLDFVLGGSPQGECFGAERSYVRNLGRAECGDAV
jgi:hypothetical protein